MWLLEVLAPPPGPVLPLPLLCVERESREMVGVVEWWAEMGVLVEGTSEDPLPNLFGELEAETTKIAI